ncbi:hypothetical protein [Paenibacillus rhizophilus]|uniref:Uncharacterized protein n=1 Tax=Paenibacillus rhizophilus TaxID=1850366 RepID=A0A3N9P7S1_9BACL|nr:hypothetical protein [Paenibacillus rhizophilus]RQW11839.1 hypothetical protein EH198_09175 [Paenibacillus rhizophilus]
MAKKKFEVKSDFLDAETGKIVQKGDVFEADEERVPVLQDADVIGKEAKTKADKGDNKSDSGGDAGADDSKKG